MKVLGVDLKASPTQESAVAIINGQAKLVYVGRFQADLELLKMAHSRRPQLIAIGAPLTLPAGLHCLEPDCSCASAEPRKKGRQAERELASMGISCFFTSKRSIVRGLIYRAIKLNAKLLRRGHIVEEVYPYATKLILWGDKVPPKNDARSVVFIREQLSGLIQGSDGCIDSLDWGACSALVSAYTALLHSRNETDQLGTPEEGLVVIPKLPH